MSPAPPATPEGLFDELLRANPSAPFVSYYDETSGERSELSAKSLANWVAKTHSLLVDELGLGVGDTAFIALPAHWISVPAILGCLTAGLALSSSPDGADVAFVEPATAGLAVGVPDVYCVAPASAAVGLRDDVPAGAQDYVLSVRPQPDAWPGVFFGATPDDPCWDGQLRAEVADAARARAAELGMTAGARVLTAHDWTGPSAWLDTLLAPLAVRGSVVYVRGADEATLARRADQEKATVRI